MRRSVTTLALLSLPLLASATGELLEQGRAVYNFRCYFCHGYSGDAKTLASTYLTPPPANFQKFDTKYLTELRVIETLNHGRPGTAMKSFKGVISDGEMAAVAFFVVDEFARRKAPNTRYHTTENGWADHDRYRLAYPFAKGEIPISRPWEELSSDQAAGKRLYLSSCVSCHDRGAPMEDGTAWDARPLSFPRNNFSLAAKPEKLDATTSASPYALHEIKPKLSHPTRLERRGEQLFQNNCAFCHGADGTGKNWIGQFLEPHPRNLQDPSFMGASSRLSIAQAIREGLPGTSMPAWKQLLSKSDINALLAYISRVFHPLTDRPTANDDRQKPH